MLATCTNIVSDKPSSSHTIRPAARRSSKAIPSNTFAASDSHSRSRPVFLHSNMAAALSLRSQMAGCTTARPVSKRTAVRVQAFQVTMKTPEGACKKFELEAGKDLLEVSSCCSLLPATILGSEYTAPDATSELAHGGCTIAVVQQHLLAADLSTVQVGPGWQLQLLISLLEFLMDPARCCQHNWQRAPGHQKQLSLQPPGRPGPNCSLTALPRQSRTHNDPNCTPCA